MRVQVQLRILGDDGTVISDDEVLHLDKAAEEFATYIRNNAGSIPNYGERWRNNEPISTAFVESTVNLVVGKRFVKKLQMQWSKRSAHLLLQTRSQTLDGTLRKMFTKWYPAIEVDPAVWTAMGRS